MCTSLLGLAKHTTDVVLPGPFSTTTGGKRARQTERDLYAHALLNRNGKDLLPSPPPPLPPSLLSFLPSSVRKIVTYCGFMGKTRPQEYSLRSRFICEMPILFVPFPKRQEASSSIIRARRMERRRRLDNGHYRMNTGAAFFFLFLFAPLYALVVNTCARPLSLSLTEHVVR